jgi:hypothetical protein
MKFLTAIANADGKALVTTLERNPGGQISLRQRGWAEAAHAPNQAVRM